MKRRKAWLVWFLMNNKESCQQNCDEVEILMKMMKMMKILTLLMMRPWVVLRGGEYCLAGACLGGHAAGGPVLVEHGGPGHLPWPGDGGAAGDGHQLQQPPILTQFRYNFTMCLTLWSQFKSLCLWLWRRLFKHCSCALDQGGGGWGGHHPCCRAWLGIFLNSSVSHW